MSDSPTLGTLIREHRLEQGLSLGQLATKLGHTSASVRRWERGEDVPSNALIVRIAEALHVEEADLRAALAVTPAAAAPKAAEPAPGKPEAPKSPAPAAASPGQEETPSPSAPDLPWEIGDEIREKSEPAEPGAAEPEPTPPEPQFELEAPPQVPEPQDKERPPPPPEAAKPEAAEPEAAKPEAAEPEAEPPQAPEPGPEPEPEGVVTKAPQAPDLSDAKPAPAAAVPAAATKPTERVAPSQPKPAAPEVAPEAPKVPVAAAAAPGAARSDRPLDITEAPTEAVPVVPQPRRSGTVPPTPSAADGAIPARPTVERPSFQNPFAVLFDPEQPWLYWIRLALLVIVGFVLFYIFVWAVGEFWDSLGELLDTFGSTEEVSDVVDGVPEN